MSYNVINSASFFFSVERPLGGLCVECVRKQTFDLFREMIFYSPLWKPARRSTKAHVVANRKQFSLLLVANGFFVTPLISGAYDDAKK